MRNMAVAFLTSAFLSFSAQAADVRAASVQATEKAESPPFKLEHPGVVALSEPQPGQWIYRKFPSLMPLYVFDDDPPGKSTCNRGCRAVWPPLRAEEDDEPVGDWTIIMRDDGRRQWAYKGKPVYMRFHDDVAAPIGDGEEGKWHLLRP